MRMFPVRQAAAFLGVSTKTLYRWDESGVLVPEARLGSGARRYSERQLLAHLGVTEPERPVRAVTYARVSSAKQAKDGNLDRQDRRLAGYCAECGYEVVFGVKETASGVNENRRGLGRVLRAARAGRFDVLVVEFPDRLARLGYRYLIAALEASSVRVEVTDGPAEAKEPTAELVDDLLAIVMVFAARMYGARASKVRARVKEALTEAGGDGD